MESASVELCAGEDSLRRAAAAPTDSERVRVLESAAVRFRRVASQARDPKIIGLALEQLATVYDAKNLDRPGDMEQVLRELIALTPDDLRPIYRLALMQESRGLIDAAETTLLDARHRQPEALEPNRQLAPFYARRVTALYQQEMQSAGKVISNPGEPDSEGVYRVGAGVKAPVREGTPVYPEEARAAGIKGAVTTEIVIDQAGDVVAARVLRSIPMLDDAAVAAVKTWKFKPTMVNGAPVPVRMVVSVNFAQP